MAAKITLVERGNPLKPEMPKKWYAQTKSTGETTLKTLGKEIAQRSTVNHADTLAVLESLTQLLSEHLSEGRIVRFGDFGAFQLSCSSEGAESEQKFNASMITGTKIVFRPGIDLKDMLKIVKFEK